MIKEMRFKNNEGFIKIKRFNEKGNEIEVEYTTPENSDGYKIIYDENDRVSSVIYNKGKVENYEYDENGNNILYYTNEGIRYSHRYNEKNLIIESDYGNGYICYFEYNENGHVVKETTYKNSIIIAEKIYEYDYEKLSSYIKINDYNGDNEVWITYNKVMGLNSNIKSYKSTEGVDYVKEFNELDLLTKYTDNTNGLVINYEYDENGFKIKRYDSGGYDRKYYYDENNRLIKIKDNSGMIINQEYNEKGDIIKMTSSDGMCEEYEYIYY